MREEQCSAGHKWLCVYRGECMYLTHEPDQFLVWLPNRECMSPKISQAVCPEDSTAQCTSLLGCRLEFFTLNHVHVALWYSTVKDLLHRPYFFIRFWVYLARDILFSHAAVADNFSIRCYASESYYRGHCGGHCVRVNETVCCLSSLFFIVPLFEVLGNFFPENASPPNGIDFWSSG